MDRLSPIPGVEHANHFLRTMRFYQYNPTFLARHGPSNWVDASFESRVGALGIDVTEKERSGRLRSPFHGGVKSIQGHRPAGKKSDFRSTFKFVIRSEDEKLKT